MKRHRGELAERLLLLTRSLEQEIDLDSTDGIAAILSERRKILDEIDGLKLDDDSRQAMSQVVACDARLIEKLQYVRLATVAEIGRGNSGRKAAASYRRSSDRSLRVDSRQ